MVTCEALIERCEKWRLYYQARLDRIIANPTLWAWQFDYELYVEDMQKSIAKLQSGELTPTVASNTCKIEFWVDPKLEMTAA